MWNVLYSSEVHRRYPKAREGTRRHPKVSQHGRHACQQSKAKSLWLSPARSRRLSVAYSIAQLTRVDSNQIYAVHFVKPWLWMKQAFKSWNYQLYEVWDLYIPYLLVIRKRMVCKHYCVYRNVGVLLSFILRQRRCCVYSFVLQRFYCTFL